MAQSDDPFEKTRMTLGEHLEELRKRVFRSVIVLAVAFGFAWWFKEDLADRVMWPWRTAVVQINADLADKAEAYLKEHPETPRTKYFLSDKLDDKNLRDPIDPRLSAFAIGEEFFFA